MSVDPQLRRIAQVSLRDHIEEQIVSAILNGIFKPGERLVELVIADQLGVSRAPVREALSALEREGVIVSNPRRGYSVISFADKDIEEIYSLRLLLELEALRRSITRFAKSDIVALQSIVDSLGDATQREHDIGEVVNLDFAFHELICKLADHSRLFAAWHNMRLQTSFLIGITMRTHNDDPGQPKELHQRILNAISAQDLVQAEMYLREHILDAQNRAMRALHQMNAEHEA